MMLPSPRPNQIIARGSKAIEGRGLNIDVSVSSRSEPTRVVVAKAVKIAAIARPAKYPCNKTDTDIHVATSI